MIALTGSLVEASLAPMTDNEVKKLIIQESIASYPERLALRRSERGQPRRWRRPASYPADATEKMVESYRDRSGIPR